MRDQVNARMQCRNFRDLLASRLSAAFSYCFVLVSNVGFLTLVIASLPGLEDALQWRNFW